MSARRRAKKEPEGLPSLSEQAKQNPERFLAQHFLAPNGKPDRNKTPTALSLVGLSSDEQAALRSAVSAVPGLRTWSEVLVIGWDSSSTPESQVRSVAQTQKATKQKAIERKEPAEKDVATLAHEAYMAELLARPRPPPRGNRNTVRMPPVHGSYIISCPDIEDGWNHTGNLTLDIKLDGPFSWIACFHFNVLEGMMALNSCRGNTNNHVRTLEGKATISDREPILDDSSSEGSDEASDEEDAESFDEEDAESDEEEDAESDEEEDAEPDDDVKPGQKRKASAAGRGRSTSKKAKATTTKDDSRRYSMEWRGRETGTGEIQLWGSKRGSVRFHGEHCTTLSGKMDIAFIGAGVRFTGRKVSDVLKPFSDSWGNYSEAAYERERVGRW